MRLVASAVKALSNTGFTIFQPCVLHPLFSVLLPEIGACIGVNSLTIEKRIGVNSDTFFFIFPAYHS